MKLDNIVYWLICDANTTDPICWTASYSCWQLQILQWRMKKQSALCLYRIQSPVKTVLESQSPAVFKSRLKTQLFDLLHNNWQWLLNLSATATEVTTVWWYGNGGIITGPPTQYRASD